MQKAWVRLAGIGMLLLVAGVFLWNRPQVAAPKDKPGPLQGYSADNFCYEFLKVALEEDVEGLLPNPERLAAERDGFYQRIRFYSDQRGDQDFELGFQARIQFYNILRHLDQPDTSDNARVVLTNQIMDCRNRLAKLGVPEKPEPSKNDEMMYNR
ncbi:hypothetical protein [Primorskyibacter sp. 2E233]|uniref:hypothetical protein n=1 Tax=Primorskyibacter sp. 2E233 TaxID=3413431 RepID=UPI003BF0FEF1